MELCRSIGSAVFKLFNPSIQNGISEPSLFLYEILKIQCNIVRQNTLKDVVSQTRWQTWQTDIKVFQRIKDRLKLYSFHICGCTFGLEAINSRIVVLNSPLWSTQIWITLKVRSVYYSFFQSLRSAYPYFGYFF